MSMTSPAGTTRPVRTLMIAATLILSAALGCTNGSSGPPGVRPSSGAGGASGNGGASGAGAPGNGGASGGGNVGVPSAGSTWSGSTGVGMFPRLPGGGAASSTPLAPGCAPASAKECPTISGACATGAGQTVQVKQFGTLCLYEETTFTQPATTIEYIEETMGGQTYYRFRVTFHPGFVDNTYGKNSIGWPPVRGHRWSDLVKSDHTELQLFDKADNLALHFKMDYISRRQRHDLRLRHPGREGRRRDHAGRRPRPRPRGLDLARPQPERLRLLLEPRL